MNLFYNGDAPKLAPTEIPKTTGVIRSINLSKCLQDFYKGETPAQLKARQHANKIRTQEMLASWREFETKYPDLAKRMIC